MDERTLGCTDGHVITTTGLRHTVAILSRETKVALFYLSSLDRKFFPARLRVKPPRVVWILVPGPSCSKGG